MRFLAMAFPRKWLEIQRSDPSSPEGFRIEEREIEAGPRDKFGIAEGECPGCKAKPFRVQGGNLRILNDRTYKADGRCVDCNDPVGYLYAKAATIFGLDEDDLLLNRGQRGRVY